jgi:hypothetical protein
MKDLFKKLLDDLSSKDVLSEERQEELNILFDTKLKDYKEKIYAEALDAVDADHITGLEKVIDKIDAEHTDLLEQVLEKVDADHTDLLNQVLESIDTNHTEQLKKVVAKYENELTEDIESKVSDFLDVYIEDKFPDNDMSKMIRLEKLEEMFKEIKNIAVISEISMDEEIKEAITDAKEIIESKDEEINQLMIDKININKKLKSIEAAKLLEDKCKNINPKMRAYIETRFKDADVDEIEDKFEEAIAAFNEDETLLREDLKSKTTSNVNPKTILTEGVVDDKTKNGQPSMMDQYINRYVRSNKYNS